MRKKLSLRTKSNGIGSSLKSSESKRNFKSSLRNKTSKIDYAKLTRNMFIIGVVLAAGTGWVWYNRLYMTPERRFWIAINNSMATPSVVRTITQGGSGNMVVQDNRLYYSPQVIENRVDYIQKSATQDTQVVTQGVVYPTEQFLRYSSFRSRTDEKGDLDINSLIGQWASSKIEDPAALEEEKLRFLSEYVSVVIFGNHTAEYRDELLSTMKESKVYGDKLNEAAESEVDGRVVYTYQIKIDLKTYAKLLNESFVRAGYGEFAPLNPDNFDEGSSLVATINVDKKNNSIVQISYNGREEKYSAYGIQNFVKKPTANITIEELQSKVQEDLGLGV